MRYKLSDLDKVLKSILLDVVVASSIHIVGWVLNFGSGMQHLSMLEGDYLISPPVYYENRGVDPLHPVYIGKLVKGQGPSQIEDDS